jgi:hypothetical protein
LILGATVGSKDCDAVGRLKDIMDGLQYGADDVGTRLGNSIGSILETIVGSKDGDAVEKLEGIIDGLQDGAADGSVVELSL